MNNIEENKKIRETDKQAPLDRLDYSDDLDPIINRIGVSYGIGEIIDFSAIEVGFEDCNVKIETTDDKYVAKIFSKERSQKDIMRYSAIMEKVVEAGVNHPELMRTGGGNAIYQDDEANGISLVLMKFIEGDNFLALDRIPDKEERQAVIEQAAKINKIDYHPTYLSDTWAIPNIKVMFEKVKKFIQPDDIKLVEQAMAQYGDIPVDELPHCFVHGDLTKANVMKGDDGKIYVIDFSVANWYPRIQELAVIAANLLHDKNSDMTLREITELVSSEYEKFNPLTAEEKQYLYSYALAAAAMEFMGAHQEKYVKGNNSKETEYWLNLGRNGLKKELSKE